MTPAELRSLLRYEPETGKLYWLPRLPSDFEDGKYSAETICKRWNKRYAGQEAFTARHALGYHVGTIHSKQYLAHRVIWALVHGEWPPHEIDHIDGDPSNNKLVNLRSVTHGENHRNQKRPCRNSTGYMGVSHWLNGSYVARIGVDYKLLHLGYFKTAEEAYAARKAAEQEHGFHPNHGR